MDLRRAVEAYKFFRGTLATEAIMQQIETAGAKPNERKGEEMLDPGVYIDLEAWGFHFLKF